RRTSLRLCLTTRLPGLTAVRLAPPVGELSAKLTERATGRRNVNGEVSTSSPKTPSSLPANLCKKPKIRPGGFPVFTIGAGCVTMQSVITASLYHSIVIEAGSAADGKEDVKERKWK